MMSSYFIWKAFRILDLKSNLIKGNFDFNHLKSIHHFFKISIVEREKYEQSKLLNHIYFV